MTYETGEAFRAALEARIQNRSQETGVSADRLRRRVLFQRIITRLRAAEPGVWVVKGGMAMEARVGDRARLTKDLDLGVRDTLDDPMQLQERLLDALATDRDTDHFSFAVSAPKQLVEDDAGIATWRVTVRGQLAGRLFGSLRLDVSPRDHEVEETDVIVLPNPLAFAGMADVEVEIVDIHRHAAEKFHAMFRDYGDRENSRFRDLADLMLMDDQGLIAPPTLATVVREVWALRDHAEPPRDFPGLPPGWPAAYERVARENSIEPQSFAEASARAATIWHSMFQAQEKPGNA
jgi:hypothetical protein